MSTAKFPFPTSPTATEQQQAKTVTIASSPIAVKTVVAQSAARKAGAAKPAAKKIAVTKTSQKTAAKPSAKVAVKPIVRSAAKAPVKTSVEPTAQPLAEPVVRKVMAKKASVKPLLSRTSVTAKLEKVRKPKLVRDSFTIPKVEYLVLDELKQRANKLTRPAKKSELLRAGIKALAALSDAAFLTALAQVPAIKTGRPTTNK